MTILGLANHARNSGALRWPESPKDALGVVKGVVGYKGKRPVLTYLVGSAAQLGVKRLAVWSVRRFRSQRNADYKKFKEEEFHFLRKYSGPEARLASEWTRMDSESSRHRLTDMWACTRIALRAHWIVLESPCP